MQQGETKLTYTVHEMAKELGMGITNAYQLVKRSDFYPAKKIGSRRYSISVNQLKEWLNEQTNQNKKGE